MAQYKRRQSSGRTALFVGRVIFRVVLYVVIILAVIYLAKSAYNFGYSVFHSEPMAQEPGQDVVVTITSDMTDQEVGSLLKNKGLIRDSLVFLIQAGIYDYQIYPGTYVLNTSETVSEMVELMSVEPEVTSYGTEAEETGETETASGED